MPLNRSTQIGCYRIEALLGTGGMGEVYRATDTRLGRKVAIKVLRSDRAPGPDDRQRFQREARAISKLNHPHICTLYDIGEYEGNDYIVMEYLEGETLAERTSKGALSIAEALRIGIEVADSMKLTATDLCIET